MKELFDMRTKLYIVICLCGYLTGCISEYEPEGVKDTAGILVVEGMVLEPTGSYVKLSRTVPITSDSPFTYIDYAQVKILGDDGSEYPLEHQDLNPGMYLHKASLSYRPGVLYAIEVRVGNRQYRSDFLQPIRTPEIEKLGWEAKDKGKTVDIQISTHDPKEEVKYFRWAYEEDWEIKVEAFTNYYWDWESMSIRDDLTLSSSFNRYYCWGHDKSKSFLLGTTDKLQSATIKDKTLLRHQASEDNSRFYYLYSILVKQYGISLEAFNYFQNLQKNIEESGSIFAPLPTEMEGNIRCIENPNEPVIGFVVATTEKTSRIYIDSKEVPEMKVNYYCEVVEDDSLDGLAAISIGLEPLSYNQESRSYTWIGKYCVNCLAHPKATKNKPEWWPNDHL